MQGLEVASSGSGGHIEAISGQTSNTEGEETSSEGQSEKEMTLGDQLNQVKDTPIASVEELHNLAGGADIKVHVFLYLSMFSRI